MGTLRSQVGALIRVTTTPQFLPGLCGVLVKRTEPGGLGQLEAMSLPTHRQARWLSCGKRNDLTRLGLLSFTNCGAMKTPFHHASYGVSGPLSS